MSIDTTARIPIPRAYTDLLNPYRYKIYYGGRGSAKSWNFARALLTRTTKEPLRIFCAREIQKSIKDSVHRLLSDQIEKLGLSPNYEVTNNEIRGINGSLFIFNGLKHNVNQIKSLEGIDIVWVEEAELISDDSWEILIPTIRKPNSEIWISFNPDKDTDPTYRRFIKNTPPNSLLKKVSWRDNPFFPDTLAKEKDYLKSVDIDAYNHIWEGDTWNRSQAQVFGGKYVIEEFEEAGLGDAYYGADWGFATDPTVLIKCFINDGNLYISQEAYGLHTETIDIPELFNKIDGSNRSIIRGDSARPEIISHLKRHGFPHMKAVEKWKGSVEDGISWIRGLKKIIIHPRCKHTIEEAKLYSYKTDRLTGDVLPELVDEHNHCWDSIRYAISPLIKPANRLIMEWA